MMEMRSPIENHLNHPVFAPSPPPGSRQGCHASPRRVSRVRMFCPTCSFESFLPRSNEEARCLKCDTLLRRRSTSGNMANCSIAHGDPLQPRRFSVEVNSYEQLMLGEWESGRCEQAPNGTHHWKFGKCQYCQKAEGEIVHGSSTSATPVGDHWCPMGGKCSFKSASCCKCGRVKERSNERRNSRQSISVSPRPSSRQSRQGSISPTPRPSSRQESVSPTPLPSSRRNSLSTQPSSMIESCAIPDTGSFGRDCPKCGYRCLSWLNHDETCLNCESLRKRNSNDKEDMHNGTRCALERLPRRQTDSANDSSATQSVSGSCQQSPNGIHHWNFGKCKYCQRAEGRSEHGSGSFCNPGGFFGNCTMGGKCMCKFGTCVKCGRVEGSVPTYAIRRISIPSKCEDHVGFDSVPVGGSLRAIRKLQQSSCKVGCEDDDQSTSAGSDDEPPMTTLPSNESRVSA